MWKWLQNENLNEFHTPEAEKGEKDMKVTRDRNSVWLPVVTTIETFHIFLNGGGGQNILEKIS